jgi:hypothetical protein
LWCCLIVTGGEKATTIFVSKTIDLEPAKLAQEKRRKLRFQKSVFTGVLEPAKRHVEIAAYSANLSGQ